MMSHAIPFAVLGSLTLVLLIHWIVRNTGDSQVPLDLDEFLKSLTDLQTGIVAEAQMERVLSPEDWEYASRAFPAHIQNMFYQERKAIVIRWLRQTHRSVFKLKKQYKRLVRQNRNLSGGMEFRLTLDFFYFWVSCEKLILLVWLWGPLHMAPSIHSTLHLARGLSIFFDRFSTDVNVLSAAEIH